MDLATTSNYDNSQEYDGYHSDDVYAEEVEIKFWTIVTLWVMCCVAWLMYCIVSHKRDMEKVENLTRENRVSRYLELQRLLLAYNSVDVENPSQTHGSP